MKNEVKILLNLLAGGQISRYTGCEIMGDVYPRECIEKDFPNSKLTADASCYYFHSEENNLPQMEALLKKYDLNYVLRDNGTLMENANGQHIPVQAFTVFVGDDEAFGKKQDFMELAFSYSEINRHQKNIDAILNRK